MLYEKSLPQKKVQIEGSSAYAESITLDSVAHLTKALELPGLAGAKNPRFLDIGANIGFTSLVIDQTVTGAEIHCFEPHPKTYSQLEENISRNATGGNAISKYPIALGEREGELPFRDIDLYNTGNSLLRDGSLASHQNKIVVPVKTLDSLELCKDRGIDLVKIDVEGFEMDVLKGGKTTFSKTKIVLLEFNHWCLSSIARVFPEDAMNTLFDTFEAVFLYDTSLRAFRRLQTDAEKWSFLHQNMVRFNVNDLLCTNDTETIRSLSA